MREGRSCSLDLAWARAALKLKHVLVDHADARGAGRVAERLEPSVGVDGQFASKFEAPRSNVFGRRTLVAETQVLVGQEFCQCEAVVHLGDADLLCCMRAEINYEVELGRMPFKP